MTGKLILSEVIDEDTILAVEFEFNGQVYFIDLDQSRFEGIRCNSFPCHGQDKNFRSYERRTIKEWYLK